MATKKKTPDPTTFTLTKGDREWTTADRTEVTNLRARGWKLDAAPEPEAAEAQVPDAAADAPATAGK